MIFTYRVLFDARHQNLKPIPYNSLVTTGTVEDAMKFYSEKLRSAVKFKTAGRRHGQSSKEWSTDSTLWTYIKENRSELLENYLIDLEDTKREALLNGSCEVEEEEDTANETKRFNFKKFLDPFRKKEGLRDDTRPVFQSVIFGSFEILRVLLKHGANILQVAENQWNIIHYLIVVSSEKVIFEEKAVEVYKQLLKELEEETIRSLLMMEDANGLRPLELAVHAGCLQMFNAIINTPGVYLVNRERKGLKEVSWYDISEYENGICCGARREKSPVLLLSYSDRKILKSDNSVAILRKGMLKQWARKKFLCNSFFIWIWFCLRFGSVVSFYYLISINMESFLPRCEHLIYNLFMLTPTENFNWTQSNISTQRNNVSWTHSITTASYSRNITNEETQQTCPRFSGWYFTVNQIENSNYIAVIIITIYLCYLLLYIVCCILFDTVSLLTLPCSNSWKWSSWQKKSKDLIVSNTFYRLCQFTFIMNVTLIFGEYANGTKVNGSIFYNGLIYTCFLSIWSLLYFVQLMPSIGQFVHSIRRMLGVMFNFIIVFALMLYPYPHAFMVMLKHGKDCQVPGFETIPNGVYSSFKIMLNMVDFSEYSAGTEMIIIIINAINAMN